MPRAREPLLGRYLVRNRAWNAWLRLSDLALALGPRHTGAANAPPRRLLLAVGGHLGDAVMATWVFDPIRATWPSVEIGVVTGSWNRRVFLDHPDIKWLHIADHWKLDRSGASLLTRFRRAAETQRRALGEIASVGYDAAADLYPYYPNSSRLFARARIPTRVGYVSGGGGPRYTRALAWTQGHATDDHATLLAALGVPRDAMKKPRYRLPTVNVAEAESAARKLKELGVAREYVVLHMGAGRPSKCWPTERWVPVAQSLLDRGFAVVLTGLGSSDAARTRTLRAQVPSVTDCCDALTWGEFRQTLARSSATLSVDTAAAHLAAAAGVPTTVIMTGIDSPSRWRPVGDRVTVLTQPVPCSPCYLADGCAAMTCIAGVGVDAVLSATAAQPTGATA